MRNRNTSQKSGLTPPKHAALISAASAMTVSIGGLLFPIEAKGDIQFSSPSGVTASLTSLAASVSVTFSINGYNATIKIRSQIIIPGFLSYFDAQIIGKPGLRFGYIGPPTAAYVPNLLAGVNLDGQQYGYAQQPWISQNGLGPWAPNNIGFVPFILGTGNPLPPPDNNNFGWLEISVGQNDLDPYIDRITVTRLAYNDVLEEPILTGDTGPAVPEPSTMAMGGLALLAMGAAGIRRRRKIDARRKAKAKEKE